MKSSNTLRGALITVVTLGLIAVSAVAVGAPRETGADARGVTPLSDAPFGTFLGGCNNNGDCAGPGLYCYGFKKIGPHCTKACASDSECGSPSKGCSERHQCAMPK